MVLRHLVNDYTLHSVETCLRDVDEQVLGSIIQHLARPFLATARRHSKAVAQAGVAMVGTGFLAWRSWGLVKHWYRERRWKQKCFLSMVTAQLLTTEIDQPSRKDVRWVDKRTLFQKDLGNIGILSDMTTQLKVVKAAAKANTEDPFVTAFLHPEDTWHVMNSFVNELSGLAGLSHLHSMQGAGKSRSDWYVIALMNPNYNDEGVARHFMGGLVGPGAASQSTRNLRLVVVWERELWNIVCRKIRIAPSGLVMERHKRRWDLLEKIANQYKRYMGRLILQQAAQDEKAASKIAGFFKQRAMRKSPGKCNNMESKMSSMQSTASCMESKASCMESKVRKVEELYKTPQDKGIDSSDPSQPGPSLLRSLRHHAPDMSIDTKLKNVMSHPRPDAQRAQTQGILQRVLTGRGRTVDNNSEVEISKDVFIQKALGLEISEVVAARLFEEFDLNNNQKVSLAEIDEAMGGIRFKRRQSYVDAHLLKVNLPLLTPEVTEFTSPKFELGRHFSR